MSPLSPRRRRAYALPFVVTAALSPGCGPRVAARRPPPRMIVNPPAPHSRPTGLPEGWSWWRSEDGTCYASPPAPDCPADTSCNPPPPRPIDCPIDDDGDIDSTAE